jgi:hypothetical protein
LEEKINDKHNRKAGGYFTRFQFGMICSSTERLLSNSRYRIEQWLLANTLDVVYFSTVKLLGNEPMAKRFVLKSRDEASAFLKHPILGRRLLECVALLMDTKGKTVYQILGSPDDVKLQSA